MGGRMVSRKVASMDMMREYARVSRKVVLMALHWGLE